MYQLTLLVVSVLVSYGGATAAINTANQTWTLVYQDEFNHTSLNQNDWHYNVETNEFCLKHRQCQYYTANRTENVRLENGTLVIEIRVEQFEGRNFTSARLDSKLQWTYGRFELRARLPSGHQLWPAIWMMPRNSTYGAWAASGEIDIMEMHGDNSHAPEGTIHYGGSSPYNIYHGSGPKQFPYDFADDFHTFTLEWTEKHFVWLIDGHQYHSENIDKIMWSKRGPNPYTKPGQPFDEPFYMILNVAVCGDYFGHGPHVTPEQAKHWKKNTMEIDYFRVYQLK